MKKVLFKLNIKYEKEMLEFSQRDTKVVSRQSSMMRQSVIREETGGGQQS